MKTEINKFVTEERCIDILSTLVKINTTHPNGNEMDVMKTILSFFKNYSITYHLIDHGENRGSLVITIPGKDASASVAFIGHVDTVPIGEPTEWSYPPFEAIIEGDYMYGRGTADMKGGVTCMIMTALHLLEQKITPAHDILFCFTADEEAGGMGILAIKESGYLDRVKELIVPEPSNEKIGIAEKGALWLDITVEGLPAHGSRPELGVNAVEKFVEFTDRFKAEVDTEFTHPLLGKATISVTKLEGGYKTNVIPDFAKASLDIRTLPSEKNDIVIKKANKVAKELMQELEHLSIKIKVENNRPPIETLPDHIFIKKVKRTFDELSIPVEFTGLYFYTDASQVVPDLQIPFVIIGPGDDKMAHQRDERIQISSIARVTEIYIRYVLDYS
ncbi:M20 family metallopeptidase [Bacillus timonensis]|uniref:M20 family metallopeptidase n=1 Tax=Bacillus timonensis TaxID=1033734 RepID=UPI000287ED6B|nr:M20 family metallopeptidase [Bacillus timonensis]